MGLNFPYTLNLQPHTLPTFQVACHPVRAIAISQKLSEKVALITGGTSGIGRRNRSEFLSSREAIVQFLTRKWLKELDYPLIKELWAFRGNRIAVRFAYEWHDDSGNWFRSYQNSVEAESHRLLSGG